jgi:hypothetical protein
MNSYDLSPGGVSHAIGGQSSAAPGPWKPSAPGIEALIKAAQVRKDTPVLGTQVGGDHYTRQKIQPITYIWANGLGFSEGNVVKYVTRWKFKGGIKDLEKAKHHLGLLIEEAQRAEREDGAKYGI